MGHVQKRVRTAADGSSQVRWQARYRGPDGRERTRRFERKKDADRWLEQQTSAIGWGEWVDPDAGRITVADWAERWLESKRSIAASTRTSYRTLLNTWVLPHLGERELRTVQRVDVDQLVADVLAAGRSANRARKVHGVVSQMLKAAVADQLVVRNVAEGVELPRLARREAEFLTDVQVDRLADAIDRRWRAWVYVCTYAGLRFS